MCFCQCNVQYSVLFGRTWDFQGLTIHWIVQWDKPGDERRDLVSWQGRVLLFTKPLCVSVGSMGHATTSVGTIGSSGGRLPHMKPIYGRGQLKCDGTRAETRFRVSAKRTSPFISAGESVQSTTGSRGVRISGSNAGYTMFRGGVKGTGYQLHSPVSPSLPLPCVTVCHHISTVVFF
jgi:hypothetical protein